MFQVNEKWIHFIGLGGVTMAPLAAVYKEEGYTVTGSDEKLYDPIKSFVEQSGLKVFDKFSYTNLINNDNVPSLIVCGSGISLKNKEYLFAKKQGLNIKHFPQILSEEVLAGDSIVVAGTYGKSTITAMLVKIFESAGIDISYMYGALNSDGTSSIKFKDNDTRYSIIEGDEYIAARWDMQSKFFYYKPKFLVLTAIQWDHTDVFKSEKEYVENFQKLVAEVANDGLIFANKDDENVRLICSLAEKDKKVIYFSVSEFEAQLDDNKISINALGKYNKLNGLTAAKFSEILGINGDAIRKGLLDFKGLKRRLEIRYKSQDSSKIVIDDFASSPAKIRGAISTLRHEFPDYKLAVIFEPNTGNRTKESIENYKKCFDGADTVLLPEFTKLIKSENYPVDEKYLEQILRDSNLNVELINDELSLSKIVDSLLLQSDKVVFAFLSSQSMEPRIQALINLLDEKET